MAWTITKETLQQENIQLKQTMTNLQDKRISNTMGTDCSVVSSDTSSSLPTVDMTTGSGAEMCKLQKENIRLREKITSLQQSMFTHALGSECSDATSETSSTLSEVANGFKHFNCKQDPCVIVSPTTDTEAHLFDTVQNKNYKILQQIGKGAFGTVYEISTKNKTKYALKVSKLNNTTAEREDDMVSFLMQHRHPNIVHFYTKYLNQVGLDRQLHILMPCKSHDLRYVLENLQCAGLYMKKCVHKHICWQIVNGLDFIHSHHICHRDLKPENVLIDLKTTQVVLCDFGSAKFLNTDKGSQTYICSRYYRAPELILDRNMYTTAIDTWSFACIFIECCIRRVLFMQKTNVDMFVAQVRIMGPVSQDDVDDMQSSCTDALQIPQFPNRVSKFEYLFKKRNFGTSYKELVCKMLVFNPLKRLTSGSILESPYWEQNES